MSENDRTEGLPEAVERRSRWAGWIWAVPIAAVAIVGYLTVREFAQRGPSVVVTFDTAGGVKPDDTKVQYQGLQVGAVTSVALQDDMHHVDVSLRLNADMANHLGPGTRFWIAGRKPNMNDLSSLKSVITGPYIGVDPHPGESQKHFTGLSEPPAVKETSAGTNYALVATKLGTVARDTPIYYRDLQVGTVEATHLQPDGRHFGITAFIRNPFDRLVHGDSHFWNASAVQVSMVGDGPRLQMQSLPALFSGAIDFETPESSTAEAAKEGSTFTLYESRSAAENAPDARSIRYRVTFDAAQVRSLAKDAAVELAHQRVGSVADSVLEYNATSGSLASHVIVAIDPSHIKMVNGTTTQSSARQQMDDLLRHLIDQGLRARIGKTTPLVGSDAVLLDFVPNASPAHLGTGDIPEIPTAPGADIGGVIASISSVGAKLNAMPIGQIADEVHQATRKLAELSNSPQLTGSLQHLDDALKSIDSVATTARKQVGPILTRLRRVANEAQSTLASAKTLLATNTPARMQPGTTGVGPALYELSRAARSLRELADYLDRHPEALLRGRDGSG